jgi:hypothetical protein
MKIHRLFCDEAGESHWDEAEVALAERSFAPPAKAIEVSDLTPAARTLFLRLQPGWNEPIHPTPVRQRLICLAGTVRVTASDGEARDIGPGDVWDMEDSHGKGHHTMVTGAGAFECVMVQFE